jgi:hypothetical protein
MQINKETTVSYTFKLQDYEYDNLKGLLEKVSGLTYSHKNLFTDTEIITAMIFLEELKNNE